MSKINLLPWRETLRKERQRDFGVLALLLVVLSVAVVVAWHLSVSGEIDYQTKRNNYIKLEITQVTKKIKEIEKLETTRASLIGRMNVIQDLQISRPQIVHLFDDVVETLPDGTYLLGLKQSGSKVEFSGRALSNARVSAYMRNIDSSEWLGSAKLKLIESNEKTDSKFSGFKLTATQRGLRANKDEEVK